MDSMNKNSQPEKEREFCHEFEAILTINNSIKLTL